MKLAEALSLRADLKRRIENLRERLRRSAAVQEGESPPENPQQLLRELDGSLERLETLILAINRTNLMTTLPDGRTLTAALARRDILRLQIGVLKVLYDSASEQTNRYSRTEIKRIPTVDAAMLQRRMDSLSTEWRELDTVVQATNWMTNLEE